jgi:hypothetical protein
MTVATPDPSTSGKPDVAAQSRSTATSSAIANAQPATNKAGRKVVVDDTVTDAQLRQILMKGYKPAGQAPGHEVSYCRSERELGSRFETKVCKTAAQILQAEQGGKEAATYVERTGAASEGARR